MKSEWTNWPDRAYFESLPKKQLKRGVWLAHPNFDEPAAMTIVAVEERPLGSYVVELGDEWRQLVCLPKPMALETFDEIIDTSVSTKAALLTLLSGGGFFLTCIDLHVFAILTSDLSSYESFFSEA